MAEQTFEIEAESLEEVREQAQAQIPEGFQISSEEVISIGEPVT
jgi:predicted Zn-dependent protease with MMP-like domain